MLDTPHKIVSYGFREFISLSSRLSEKIKDRYFWLRHETDEAEKFLLYFRDNLKKKKVKKEMYYRVFGESGSFFSLKPFKKGYNAKLITFKTIVGSDERHWVLKIGHRISPVIDYGDPSTPAYYKQLQYYSTVLKQQTMKYSALQYLIPEPQEIMWGVLDVDKKKITSTLIIQPFIRIIKPEHINKFVPKEQGESLLKELNEFENLCINLIKHHKLRPDLLGEGNLSISKIGNNYHLVLLDMGLVNLRAPLPITQTFMHFASLQTVASLKHQITKLTVA